MKRLSLLFLLVALYSESAWAQIAYDNATAGGFQASGNSLTFSHTVNSNTNGQLSVCAYSRNNQTVSGVTYNGVAMTKAAEVTDSTFGVVYASLWSLVAPATGANNVVVSFTGTPSVMSGASAVSYTGVDQTTPYSNATTNSGNSASSTVTVTSSTGSLVVDCMTSASGSVAADPTPGAGQTGRGVQHDSMAQGDGFGLSQKNGAASVAMTWTWDGVAHVWDALGFNLNTATAVVVGGSSFSLKVAR